MPKADAVCPFYDTSMRADKLRRHINNKNVTQNL